MSIDRLPEPPYYAAIFTSLRSGVDPEGYARAAVRMEELAARRPGFLGVESVRNVEGRGVTISYWSDLASLREWGRDAEHLESQAKGRAVWYDEFRLEICRVESRRDFQKTEKEPGVMNSDLSERFARLPAEFRRALEGLTEAELKTPIGPGEWSIQQLVVHVADTDAVILERMKRVIAEETPTILAFSENRWLERLATNEQLLDDSVLQMEVMHRQFARVLPTLSAEDWARIGVHSEAGPLTLESYFRKSVGHAEHHLKFLVAKRDSLGKPLPPAAWGSAT